MMLKYYIKNQMATNLDLKFLKKFSKTFDLCYLNSENVLIHWTGKRFYVEFQE